MRIRRSVVLAAAFLTGCLTAGAGCGGGEKKFAEVAGRVVIDGKPVTAGEVYFSPVDDPNGGNGAQLNDKGAYASKSIPVGKCRVSVKTKQFAPSAPGGNSGKMTVGPQTQQTKTPDWVKNYGGSMPTPGAYVAIPAKYEDQLLSGLEFDVKSGTNTFDIVLTEKK